MLAKVQGLFRMVRDVELRYTQSGTAVAKLGLACSEKYGDKETQLFIDGTVFGKQAETINQYAGSKGTQIFIVGKLQTEQWQDQQGQNRSKVSMIVESFDFVSGQNKQNNGQANGSQQQPQDYTQGTNGQQIPVYQENVQQQPTQQQYQQQQMPPQQPQIDINEDEIPF